MAQEHESQEQEVTAQDQGHINEFSRLNVKYHELEEDLRGKEEVLVNLQDSSNEVMMMLDDEEMVKFSVGEAYVDLSQEAATEHIERLVADVEEEVAKLQAELAGAKGRMKELKSLLTVKFGKTINLEEDE
eukprot:CAMPEP_0179421302 /NCGR_PEP_ID=MMETSP0799-20121207/9686_1 /TAXON_ID=46947 /ORGANISM="Geminigera cryophila, Strain CCMP2564" /LENGTH=130 /DNA_ID=CAMNT_0021195085 /DNA_START=108 /DNA_END=500 /DNA_ORIENTATION=-